MSLLPEGYKRLLYIESTGTQYVDTGWKPNSNTRLLMGIEVRSAGTSFLFGARHNSSANSVSSSFSMPQISGASLRSDFGSVESAISVSPMQKLDINKDKNVTSVNGSSVTATTQTFSCSYNLAIFAVNTAGTVSAHTSARMYSCKIYDNGTLIRNFIPCQKDDGTVGLYDTVNSAFYGNSGTGSFVAGPEWGYIELEYIKSTGTQYIDCGISVPHATARTVVDFEVTTLGATQVVTGHMNGAFSWSTNFLYMYRDNVFAVNQTNLSSIPATVGSRYVFDYTNKSLNVNGVTYSTSQRSYTDGYNDAIFYSTDYPGKFKLFSYRLYDGDAIVRDMIPAKLTDGSIGMIDRLTEEFYPNRGTGTFIAGPELYGNDEHTLMLLHFDEFKDSSPANRAITSMNAQISAGQKKFGETSGYFNGAAQVFATPIDFSDKDFTIDWWEYVAASGSKARFCTMYTTESLNWGGLLAGYNGTNIYASSVFSSTAWDLISGASMLSNTVNEWVHWAFVRSGNVLTAYRNGVKFASATLSGALSFNNAYNFVIGDYRAGDHAYFNGYIDEFRVSDIARWTGDFAVQVEAYKEPPSEEVIPRKLTIAIVPPEQGEKTADFTVQYSVADNFETEEISITEQIDGEETAAFTITSGDIVNTIIHSTEMDDGEHTFTIVADGVVEAEYTFVVNNSTITVILTDIDMTLPQSVIVNETFKISIIMNESTATIARLVLRSGDLYAGEV